ncbi:MAG TPA: 30S ribosomal protein S6 [Solirubrobacteraceae bacterium]|nr:30S ribosomal protein S6 [Solirubrobacteraceae bacterium]
MTAEPATYDLVVILDPQAADDARTKIVRDARAAIESEGTLVRHDEWGERALSYPIERHPTGEYHLLQFHPGGTALLGELDRTLRIADGVLRHRIIKLDPGTPSPPDMRTSAPARRAEGEGEAAQQAPAAPAEPPAAAAAEPPAPAEEPVAAAAEPAAPEPQPDGDDAVADSA